MRNIRLDEIVQSGLCSGCGACNFVVIDGSISMSISADGFLRPIASRTLTNDEHSQIRSICPGIGLTHSATFDPGVTYSPEWGPIAELKTGHAIDPEVRFKGSSGGTLSALLIHLIETKKVDFVVHTRPSITVPLRNDIVFSSTREDILAAAGSRYSPAAPVSALRTAVSRPGRFAFVGKPCDVAAVRKILQSRSDLTDRIPYLLSFMCAGTPSLNGTYAILKQFEMTPADLSYFRYRGEGWPGNTKAITKSGRTETMSYGQAWGQHLNKHLQRRCKMCADGTGEFADVVCADAWHGKHGYPDFSEADGRSLIIARTSVGSTVLSEAAEDIHTESFPLKELAGIQPYQLRRKREIQARLLAAKLLLSAHPKYVGFRLTACLRNHGKLATLKAIAGTLKRLISGKM